MLRDLRHELGLADRVRFLGIVHGKEKAALFRGCEFFVCPSRWQEPFGLINLEAMAAGKLTEAQRDWALRLALKDAESFDEWADRAPVVIVLGKMAGPEGADPVDRRAHGAGARARIEYQADSLLQALTSEEAFVQQAIRECRQ